MRGTLLGTRREPTLAAPAPVRRAAESGLASPQPWLMGALGALSSASGLPVTPLTALQSAAVYSCVRCLSEDLAKLPLGVRRKLSDGGSVPEPRHALNALFQRPNRWMTGFDFVAYIVTALCLRGNGYAVIKRGRGGEPIELIPVSPDRVSLLLAPNGLLYYMVHHPAVGDAVTLHQDDMLHIRSLSLDGYVGISPIAVAQDAIGLALATQQHGATLFRQGAQVSGVLRATSKLSPEAA
ncbi:MAG TPA: phage portal protein, partial [Gemmatimonadales bacterium]|nr:phage portal protein [Gemmatimonadales bacterium]